MQYLKKASLLLLVCLLLLTLAACQDNNNQKGEINLHNSDDASELVNLTEEEIGFLAVCGYSSQRIQAGNLTSVEKRLVQVYQAALEFLNDKYPSHSFTIWGCVQNGAAQSFDTFYFYADGNNNVSYDLNLTTDAATGAYACEDNFYGSLIKDEYEAYLSSMLKDKVAALLAVSSSVPNTYGREYDEDLSVADILQQELPLRSLSAVYIDGTGMSENAALSLAQQICELLEGSNLNISLTVIALASLPAGLSTAADYNEYVKTIDNSQLLLRKQFIIFAS